MNYPQKIHKPKELFICGFFFSNFPSLVFISFIYFQFYGEAQKLRKSVPKVCIIQVQKVRKCVQM